MLVGWRIESPRRWNRRTFNNPVNRTVPEHQPTATVPINNRQSVRGHDGGSHQQAAPVASSPDAATSRAIAGHLPSRRRAPSRNAGREAPSSITGAAPVVGSMKPRRKRWPGAVHCFSRRPRSSHCGHRPVHTERQRPRNTRRDAAERDARCVLPAMPVRHSRHYLGAGLCRVGRSL